MPTPRPDQLQQRFIDHMRALLGDPRLRVDTKAGLRPVTTFRQHVVLDTPVHGDDGFPPGLLLDISLLRQKWILLADHAGRLYQRVLTDDLTDDSAAPIPSSTLVRLLTSVTGPAVPKVPTTVVLASTTGFTPDARELAERRAQRTVILLEPNGVGGFRVHGPNETKAITELFDPETEDEKRARLRAYVSSRQGDLGSSGLSSEKLALATMLSDTFVEAELKSIVQDLPGWAARRLDGRIVLFRQDAALAAPTPAPTSDTPHLRIGAAAIYPAPADPMLERIGSLFTRKGETEKKITYISERRSTLGQLRDRLYEELSAIEAREAQLKADYPPPSAPAPTAADAPPRTFGMAKRRIAAQLVSLRADARRRQEQVGQLNAMISALGVHLQQLELARTGVNTELADGQSIAGDVARAEQLLAEFQPAPDLPALLRRVPMLSPEVSDAEAAILEELETQSFRGPAAPQNPPTMRLANGTGRE